MSRRYDPCDYPPGIPNMTSYELTTAGELAAEHISRIVTLDVTVGELVHATVTGDLRAVTHSSRETVIDLAAHDGSTSETIQFTLEPDHPLAVWAERRG